MWGSISQIRSGKPSRDSYENMESPKLFMNWKILNIANCVNTCYIQFSHSFQTLTPYTNALLDNPEGRFPDIDVLERFRMFDPEEARKEVNVDDPEYGDQAVADLVEKFPQHLNKRQLLADCEWLNEWMLADPSIRVNENIGMKIFDSHLSLFYISWS